MNVVDLKAANAKNKDIKYVNTFGKSMPAGFDADGILQDGDVIIMPAAITPGTVGQQTFGTNNAEFLEVEVERGADKVGINFFPLSMMKNFWPAVKNEDGSVETITASGPVNPDGTAVDVFKSFQGKGDDVTTDTQLGVNALLGKRIKVTLKQEVTVQKWRNGGPIDDTKVQKCWHYNFV